MIDATNITCPYCLKSMGVLLGFFDLESYNCSNCGKNFYVKEKSKTFKTEDIKITYEYLKGIAEKAFPNNAEKQETYIKLLQKVKTY